MQLTERRLAGELADVIGDPAPDGRTVVIVLRSELVGARAAPSSSALSPYRGTA